MLEEVSNVKVIPMAVSNAFLILFVEFDLTNLFLLLNCDVLTFLGHSFNV